MPLPRKTPSPRSAGQHPRTPKPPVGANLCATWAAAAQILTEVKATDALLREPLTESLSHFLAGQYAIAINNAVTAGPLKPRTLSAFASDVAALRKGDQNAAWLRLERHRVGLEYRRLRLAMSDSLENRKSKLLLALEIFRKHLAGHPDARAAFAAFAVKLRESSGMLPETPENPTQSA